MTRGYKLQAVLGEWWIYWDDGARTGPFSSALAADDYATLDEKR